MRALEQLVEDTNAAQGGGGAEGRLLLIDSRNLVDNKSLVGFGTDIKPFLMRPFTLRNKTFGRRRVQLRVCVEPYH
eukprot:3157227-Pyramimonas_sp.AAC.1